MQAFIHVENCALWTTIVHFFFFLIPSTTTPLTEKNELNGLDGAQILKAAQQIDELLVIKSIVSMDNNAQGKYIVSH